MIEAHIARDAGGRIEAFQVTGHAGSGDYGKDIVCAAVSVLAQATVNGLEQRLGLRPQVRTGDGDLACRLPPDLPPHLAERAQDLLETMVFALRNLAEQERYRRYITIHERTTP